MIQLEHTGPGNAQLNGRVETKFYSMYGSVNMHLLKTELRGLVQILYRFERSDILMAYKNTVMIHMTKSVVVLGIEGNDYCEINHISGTKFSIK